MDPKSGMMEDGLEDFIKNNRQEFDRESPKEDHLKRFEALLQEEAKPEAKVVSIQVKYLWRVAAAAVILLGVGIGLWWNGGEVVSDQLAVQPEEQVAPTLASISPELAEVEDFFVQTVSNRVNDVKAFGMEEEAFVQTCFDHIAILEAEYDTLQQDLLVNHHDERVINSMIQNYRTRLMILEQLLQQMENVNDRKNMNYEDVQS